MSGTGNSGTGVRQLTASRIDWVTLPSADFRVYKGDNYVGRAIAVGAEDIRIVLVLTAKGVLVTVSMTSEHTMTFGMKIAPISDSNN